MIPKELGGVDSKYNLHLMLRSDNSRFGHFYTQEKVELVGAANAKVAQRVRADGTAPGPGSLRRDWL